VIDSTGIKVLYWQKTAAGEWSIVREVFREVDWKPAAIPSVSSLMALLARPSKKETAH